MYFVSCMYTWISTFYSFRFWGNPEARYLEVVLAIQCGHTGESRMQPEKSSSGNRVMLPSEKQRFWGDPFMKNREPASTFTVCKNARMTFSRFVRLISFISFILCLYKMNAYSLDTQIQFSESGKIISSKIFQWFHAFQ